MDPIVEDGHVNIYDISFLQQCIVGYAVANDLPPFIHNRLLTDKHINNAKYLLH